MPSIWSSKQMWRAVFLTIALHLLVDITTHYLMRGVVQNIAKILPDAVRGSTDEELEHLNQPLITLGMFKEQLLTALLLPLDYRWQVWLEAAFPSRPRPKTEFKDKPLTSVNEALEDEIMRRLIAEGKVRRASVRWGNVFIKLLLDLIVGSIIFGALWTPIDRLSKFEPWNITPGAVGGDILEQLVGRIFTGWIVVAVLKFILIPVEHRLPFEAGMELVIAIFVSAFLGIVLPWAASTETVQVGLTKARAAELQEAIGNLTNTTISSGALEVADGTEI